MTRQMKLISASGITYDDDGASAESNIHRVIYPVSDVSFDMTNDMKVKNLMSDTMYIINKKKMVRSAKFEVLCPTLATLNYLHGEHVAARKFTIRWGDAASNWQLYDTPGGTAKDAQGYITKLSERIKGKAYIVTIEMSIGYTVI